MGTEDGNVHTAAVKQVIADIWQSKIVKAAAIGGGIVISIWLAGKIFTIVGDAGKAFLKMRDSFKHAIPPPPLIK